MNLRTSFYLIAGCLLLSLTLKAQYNLFNNHSIPLKSLESPAFGQDIVLHDAPDQYQMSIAICSAFNG